MMEARPTRMPSGKCFEEISGLSRAEVEQETLDFYANEFNEAIASTNRIRAQTRLLNC